MLPRVLRVAAWAVICWVVVFWGRGHLPLLDPDEAHYAQLTHEMLQAGNWLVPLLDGEPYIDKPVLFHWMQGLTVQFLGETELAMRLPTTLAALALLWITWWTGQQLFSKRVGDRGAMMFATIPLTFMLAGVGVFDMIFTTFLFGAVACVLVSALRARPRLQYVGYLLLVLAVMTKGPVALLLAAIFFAVGLLCGRECRAALLSLHWLRGSVVVVVASLPWFVWMWLTFGTQFVQHYFLAGNLWYVTQPAHFSSRAFNHTLYASTFLAGFFPWSLVVLGAVIDGIRRWRSGSRLKPEEILLWAWMAVVFVFFSVARFKVDRYVYPAAPACCLLAAHAWLSASVSRADLAVARDNYGAKWSIGLLGICLVAAGVIAGLVLFRLGLDLPPVAILIPISLFAGGAALTLTMTLRRAVSPALFAGVLLMLLVIYGCVVTIGFPIIDRVRPTAEVAQALRVHLADGDRVALYRLERWRSSLRYYVQRPLEGLRDPAELEQFLQRTPEGYVLMLGDEYCRLNGLGMGLRLITTRPAVTGTTGQGLRKQKWGTLVVAAADRRPNQVAQR